MASGAERPPEISVLAPRPGASGPADPWAELVREIEGCTRCALHATRTHVVVYRGSRTPRVVFVGEAPGAEEDRVGVPFVGRSGRRLDAAIATLPLAASEFGILNLVKCRPPKNHFLASAERSCRPYLDRQFSLLSPSLRVTLGAHALAALDRSAPPILQCAGRLRSPEHVPLFPLIHPAAALRSTRLARRWDEDLAHLRSYLAGNEFASVRERL
jgi:uracil-DNA glycosylase